MENEIWKDIPNYEGHYQVSNFGNVKSLSRWYKSGCGYKLRFREERMLTKSIGDVGYLFVSLWKNGKVKGFRVHQLVAIAFLNHKPNAYKKVVDHIDNDPSNNRLENLQLITQRHNSSKDKKGYTSQYVGVCWYKQRNVWRAGIMIKGKRIYLGYFNNEIDAHLCYQNKLKQLGL
jgi:hypothetical protein